LRDKEYEYYSQRYTINVSEIDHKKLQEDLENLARKSSFDIEQAFVLLAAGVVLAKPGDSIQASR
jgi:hypothetical protein